MAEENITWNDAISSSGFVRLEEDKEKVIIIRNWTFERVDKFGEEQIEFQADCIEEDGEKVEGKQFTTTSSRLKRKLRPIFEGKDNTIDIKISILKVGDKFDTQYSIKEIKE